MASTDSLFDAFHYSATRRRHVFGVTKAVALPRALQSFAKYAASCVLVGSALQRDRGVSPGRPPQVSQQRRPRGEAFGGERLRLGRRSAEDVEAAALVDLVDAFDEQVRLANEADRGLEVVAAQLRRGH